MKKISVVMATNNGSRFIEKALDSVISQNYPDFEIIVVDDGSTDDTRWVIGGMQRKDYRVQYYQTENQGPGLARNLGVLKAVGEYVAFIDDDDIWDDKDKLKKQASFLDKHKDCVIAGSSETKIIDGLGRHIKDFSLPHNDEEIRKKILLKNCFINSSVMFRKKAFERVKGFKNMRLAEDYDLWLRMGRMGKFANIDTGVSYRIHASNASSKKKLEMYRTVLSLVKKYRNDYPRFPLAYLKARLRILHFYIFKK